MVTELLKKIARRVLRRDIALLNGTIDADRAINRSLAARVQRAEAVALEHAKRTALIANWIEYVYRGDDQTSEHRAIIEYLRYGADGFAPKQMGVHPFKRYDRWPMPEDVERLINEEDERRASHEESHADA